MITEDRVQFEIAKLLRDKGFEQDTVSYPYYTDNGNLFTGDVNTPRQRYYNAASAPTLQMAMKWLREVHKCYMHICPFYPESKYNEPPKWIAAVDYDGIGHPVLNEKFNTYEEACEAAIKYCLENLI